MSNKLTELQNQEVIECYKQGLTTSKIAEQFSVCKSTITNTLKNNNIQTRTLSDYKKFSSRQEWEIIELYKNEKTMTDIAKDFKCSVAVIDRIFKEHNIQKKQKGLSKRKLSKVQEQEVIKLYEKGKTIKLIAKRYDVNIVTISSILKRNNVEIRKIIIKKIFPEQEKEIIELYNKAWSLEEMSSKLNLAKSIITRILKEKDIYESVRNRKKVNSSLIPENQRIRIMLLYQKGLSITKLSKEYGVVPETIRRVLDLNNIKIRQPEYYTKKLFDDKKSAKIVELYEKGQPASQIAKKFNVRSRVITRILNEKKVELNLQGYYQKKLNENDVLEIIKLYQQGFTKTKLSEQFNVSTTTISETLKRNNIESRKNSHTIKVTEDIEKEIIRLYKETRSLREVAKLLNLSHSTINLKLHKHNLSVT